MSESAVELTSFGSTQIAIKFGTWKVRQGVRLTIFLRSKIEESIYKYIYFSPLPPSPTYTFVLSKIVLSPPFFCKSPIRSTKGALKIKTLVECSPFSCPFSVNKRFTGFMQNPEIRLSSCAD